jgi:hypothetical protein
MRLAILRAGPEVLRVKKSRIGFLRRAFLPTAGRAVLTRVRCGDAVVRALMITNPSFALVHSCTRLWGS